MTPPPLELFRKFIRFGRGMRPLVGANRRLLNARFHDLGGQLLKLKEQEFNNGLDRQNIKDQIVELQTRSENNLRKQNIQVKSIFIGKF